MSNLYKEKNMSKKLRSFYVLLLCGLFFFQAQQGLSQPPGSDGAFKKPSNNIAVASVGGTVNSEISNIAGRAPYYLIFDENDVLLKSTENPSRHGRRDSSSGVIALLLEESCTKVIAGAFGNKMLGQLKERNIEYYERTGIVQDAVQAFIKK